MTPAAQRHCRRQPSVPVQRGTATGLIAGTSNYGIPCRERRDSDEHDDQRLQAASAAERPRRSTEARPDATDGDRSCPGWWHSASLPKTARRRQAWTGERGSGQRRAALSPTTSAWPTAVTAISAVGGGLNYGIYVENAATATSLTVNAIGQRRQYRHRGLQQRRRRDLGHRNGCSRRDIVQRHRHRTGRRVERTDRDRVGQQVGLRSWRPISALARHR